MSKISDVSYQTIRAFQSKVEANLKGSACLQDAAQTFTNVMYEEFEDSIVLVRLFGVMPFGGLPATDQAFVTNIAIENKVIPLLNDQTLVFSLLGTRGENTSWNKRQNSQGHIGIPLISERFIETIPMISRMLKEHGVPLNQISSQNTEIAKAATKKMSGLYYVADAKTSVDEKNRKIITALDFVNRHDVKTVFGFGGSYLIVNTFISVVVFTRETVEKSQADLFKPIANVIKLATTNVVFENKIFA